LQTVIEVVYYAPPP